MTPPPPPPSGLTPPYGLARANADDDTVAAVADAAALPTTPSTPDTPIRRPTKHQVNRECPICGKLMNHLRPHLTGYHKVTNVEEKMLLVSWSSGRVTGKLNCNFCAKVGLSRLDRHLADLHQLPPNEVDEQMLVCKKQLVVVKLGELRATSPTVPMVSRLDEPRSTPKRSPLAPPPPSPGPVAVGFLASSPSTPTPMPIHRVEWLESSVRQLQAAQATSSAALASPSPGNKNIFFFEEDLSMMSPTSTLFARLYSPM
ncbi:unnamed protein product [Arctogadus glacialis]